MRFCTHTIWKSLFLLLWVATSLCNAAQLRFQDVPDSDHDWLTPLPALDEDDGPPPAPAATGSKDRVQHHEIVGDRFQWKSALSQYLFEISIQHGWRFAHEKGTRDATANGPWLHDWVNSMGETRGWDDGDGWHASYVGHPLNGGIYCFIEQQNDPRYRRVEWGDGRIYWMSRLRAVAFSAAASAQWTLGPLSEASLGNVQLHSSPGFIDIVQTPGLGVMEMMGEDLIDRYLILPLENRTANPWILMAARSLGNPARSFAALMSLRWGWNRENRPGLFGANHAERKELLAEYKKGLISAPYGPHTPEERALMNQAVESAHGNLAPIELQAYANYENLLNTRNCVGGGAEGAVRIRPAWQLVTQVDGCMVSDTPANESADSVSFSAGARWTPHAIGRISPFAQVLVGGRRVTYEIQNPQLRDSLLNEWNEGTLPHYPKRTDYQVEYQALGFKLTMGGGIDAVFGRAFAWRVLDVNYSHTWMPEVHSINASDTVQLTTGLVLRIGNW